jgi:hypothetical protein
MGRNAASERLSSLDGQAPESTDFANYFCTYAYLYHQVCLVACPRPGLAAVPQPALAGRWRRHEAAAASAAAVAWGSRPDFGHDHRILQATLRRSCTRRSYGLVLAATPLPTQLAREEQVAPPAANLRRSSMTRHRLAGNQRAHPLTDLRAQKDMLEDHKRTGAYYNAVLQNRRQFHGKVTRPSGTAQRPCDPAVVSQRAWHGLVFAPY